jgi:kynurenine 3-monooxygenase
MTDRDVVNILGAGLCGSLLAVMLARRGFPVTLRELRADPRSSSQSAGRSINLALSARGIRGLKHAGVFDKIRHLLLPMRGRMIHETDGGMTLLPYGQREHEMIYSVSRAELNRILIDVAEREFGVEILFEHGVAGFDTRTQTVRMRHRDGDYELPAQGLIAADGAGSHIRRAYDGNEAIGPVESLLPHSYKELTIPPAPDGGFELDESALHIWPRSDFMLIALPNPGGDFTLTLFMPTEGRNSFAALETREQVQAFFAEHFADVVPLIPDLAQTYLRNPVGILGTVRCRHWHVGDRFLLIGDAAHAIVPFHGQGMNLAFEDCVLLDELVADEPAPDWGSVFAEFEATQRPNADAIADMALENYVEMRDTVLDPKFALQKELSFELERRMPDRFIPRYSMVMFHDEIPYAVAQQRGRLQAALLAEFTEHADALDQIDLDAAERAARDRLPPL